MKHVKRRNSALIWKVWLIALVIILITGILYRITAKKLNLTERNKSELTVQLGNLPYIINNWGGSDVPIEENIQRVAGNTDYVNRLYIGQDDKSWANVYIAFCANPKYMMGHRPDICYVSAGWVHDSTEAKELMTDKGLKVPCLIHHFYKPVPQTDEIYVLNYYIVNGKITNQESMFTGLGWRVASIAGKPALYVAQVQISSTLENNIIKAARNMTDTIVDYLPDEDGKTRAVQ